MNTRLYNKFVRMTQVLVILSMVFSVMGSASAAPRALPGDWDGKAVLRATVLKEPDGYKMWYDGQDINGKEQVGLATSSDGKSWTKYADNPVLDGGPDDWDASGEHTPFVLKEDGVYKMWYEGADANGTRQLGYATSEDGITWTKYEGNPVVRVGTGYDGLAAAHGSVLHEGELYKLWYHANGDQGYIIAYATSPDGINWTKVGPALLLPQGAWDQWSVWGPSVLKVGGTYWMWYAGAGPDNPISIGAATSTDGVTWSREGNAPVLTLAENNLGDPHVILDGTTFKMWFHSFGDGKIYYAESNNGLDWGNFSEVLTPGVLSPLEGWHDGNEGEVDANSCSAFGWAVDPDDRDRDVQIQVFSDEVQVAQGLASDYGQDMEENNICPGGTCRFTINLLGVISTNEPHQITVKAYDPETADWWNLGGTPRTLNCQTHPYIEVRANEDRVRAWDWPRGDTLTLTINGDEFPVKAVVGDNPWGDLRSYAEFDLWEGNEPYKIQPDDILTLSNEAGTITKTTTVTKLAFTNIDVNADTITGMAEAGSTVHIWACDENGCPDRAVTADSGGTWTAYFGVAGEGQTTVDIVPGTWVASQQVDEDGDQTEFGQNVPNPFIEAGPYGDWIHARGWLSGTPIRLEIDNPSNGTGVDYTEDGVMGQAPWNPGDPNDIAADFRWPDQFTPGPGYIIAMTGDVYGNPVTKSLIVSKLYVSKADAATDTVIGIADPGTPVHVCANIPNDCVTRWVTPAGTTGSWTAYYDRGGVPPDDEATVNLLPGSNGWASQDDGDGDITWYDWNVPNPRFGVRANEDKVEAWEWTLGDQLTLTVGGHTFTGTVGSDPGDPKGTYVEFFTAGSYDIQPGDSVSLTNGPITKTTTVTPLAFTNIDVNADTVTGKAEAGSTVHIGACVEKGCLERTVTVDSTGVWTAYFGVAGEGQATVDIVGGTWVDSWQFDEDGDRTMFGQGAPNPRFDVRPNWDMVEGYEWTNGETLTLEVGGKTLTAVVGQDPWDSSPTAVGFNLSGIYDIQPGDVVSLSNGTITKTITVTDLAITGFNVDADTVQGAATTDLPIDLWACDSTNCYNRHVTAPGGTWKADFSKSGTLGDEQNTVNIAGDVWVDSQQVDEDSDRTMYGWTVPRFVVFPEWEWFDGLGWPDGHTVTITVAGKPECGAAPVSSGGFFNGSFGAACNVMPGDKVNFTDGITTSTHTVQNLAITSAKAGTDKVTGTAEPGAIVTVWPHGHDQIATLQPTVNAGGTWTADFTTVGFNLVPGINGRSEIRDQSGNSTAVDWLVPVVDWKQVNTSGFGDSQNSGITALEVFQGQLYAGTFNGDAGGQVWRLGPKGQWLRVSQSGFGSGLGGSAILDLVVFQGQLYAGTGWNGTPGQAWRTANGTTWQPVTTDGFGITGNIGVTAFAVFNDVLYAGTENENGGAQIWRSSSGKSGSWKQVAPDGPGLIGNVAAFAVYKNQLYAAVESQRDSQMQVWRSANGSDWTTVVPDGFGFEKSKFTSGFVQFGGYLYLGTYNEDTGGQLWRTNDGLHWKQVVGDGFGDPNNKEIQALRVYNGVFYASTVNDALGMQLWRSSDGLKWVQVTANGFGDSGNVLSIWGSANIEYQERLYIGTMNNNEGGELWMSASAANSQAGLPTKSGPKPGVSIGSGPKYENGTMPANPGYPYMTAQIHPDSTARYRSVLARALQYEYRARYPAPQYYRPHPPQH